MPYRFLKRRGQADYFHVYGRGNNKKTLFFVASDFQRFVGRLKEYSQFEKVEVVAYCLMRNHYHLLLKEANLGDIARLMQRLGGSHAKYLNLKYGQTGHLFEGPYCEKSVDSDAYLLEVSAYIHNNPKDLDTDPTDYRWSSYSDYLGGQNSWINKNDILAYFTQIDKVAAYHDFVSSCNTPETQEWRLNQNLVSPRRTKPGFEMVTLK